MVRTASSWARVAASEAAVGSTAKRSSLKWRKSWGDSLVSVIHRTTS